jgi:hypothetical protein
LMKSRLRIGFLPSHDRDARRPFVLTRNCGGCYRYAI